MIRNIFNWVGGGFFRTIGRFVAFIVLGAIAYILIGKSNIKITDLLGIETVKADTLTNTVWQTYYKNDSLTQQLPTSTSGNYQYNIFAKTNTDIYATYVYMGTDIVKSNYDYIIIPFTLFGSTSYTETIPDDTYHQCIIDSTENAYGQRVYTNFRCFDTTYSNYNKEVKISVALVERNGDNQSPCVFENGNLKCSVLPNVNYGRLYVSYYVPNELDYKVYYSFGKAIQQFKDIFNTIAENQETQINQQNGTMSYFQDANMTETNSTATSFFDNFTDTDHGGLSSIITAPLSTINNMLSNTCVAPSATWKGATITLPCGDLLWSRPGADGLRNLLNVFYGGFICYYAIRRLFFLIENLKDPTKDNLEVTDL